MLGFIEATLSVYSKPLFFFFFLNLGLLELGTVINPLKFFQLSSTNAVVESMSAVVSVIHPIGLRPVSELYTSDTFCNGWLCPIL